MTRSAKIVVITMIIIIMTYLPATSQVGDFFNGNDLYTKCVSKDYEEQGICLGYSLGIMDDMAWDSKTWDFIKRGIYCAPRAGVTAGQVRDVVTKFLVEHPEERDFMPASISARVALAKAFFCEKK
jgi:hypothetical protein